MMRTVSFVFEEARLTAVRVWARVAGGCDCVTTSNEFKEEKGLSFRRTNLTYSLSVLVVRTSGSLPSLPIKMSFAMSPERAVVVEKPCKSGHVSMASPRSVI